MSCWLHDPSVVRVLRRLHESRPATYLAFVAFTFSSLSSTAFGAFTSRLTCARLRRAAFVAFTRSHCGVAAVAPSPPSRSARPMLLVRLRVPAPSCAFTSCLCSGSAPFVAFTNNIQPACAPSPPSRSVKQMPSGSFVAFTTGGYIETSFVRLRRIARHSPFVAFTIAYPEPSPSSPSRFFGRAHESAFVAFTIVSVREAVVPSSPSSRSPAVSFRTPQTIERVPLRHLHVFWPVGLSAGRPSFAFTILCQLSLAVSRLRRSTSTVAQTLRRPMPSMPSLLPASPRVWSAAFDAFTIFRVDTAGLYLRRLHDSVNCPRSVWLDFPSTPSRSFSVSCRGLVCYRAR